MHPSVQQSQELARERAIELAEQDIPIIDELLDSKGWAYLARRLREQRDAIRAKIADDEDLSARETRILRRVAKEYDAILRLPHNDRTVHQGTLAADKQRATGPSRG